MNDTVRFILGLAVMAGLTYIIRLLPMLFIKKKIENRFIRSFLYYVPYTVLAVMSFPTIVHCTGNIASGISATAACIVLAYMNLGMMPVALGGALTVLITESIIGLL